MNAQPTSGPSAIWGILAGIVMIVALIGGSLYAVGDLSTQRARAVADAESYRAQQAYAQVEIVRAHESGSTERMQVFALTLKSLTSENQMQLTFLSVGVLILGILQLVQALTRSRGGV